jgi:Ni/Co efflux regulator RcnB
MDFSKAKELADKKATDYVGKPKKDCPKQKSCLIVVVYKQDTNEVIKSAKVQVAGTATDAKGKTSQKSKSENTDGKGIAKFKPWDPGDYTVDISIPKIDGYEKPLVTQQSVGSGACPVVCIPVKPLPKLKVKVVQKGNHARVFSDATVKLVSAPQQHPDQKTIRAGIANYGRTQSGKYVVQVTALKEEDRKEFAVPRGTVEETLSSGDDKTVIIEVEKINVVTPKIEMEYKVVLFDRGLWKYQEATEEKIYPDPTYIQLSFRQTNAGNPFEKGGKVKFSPANVEVFLDEECKKKAPGDPRSGIDVKAEEISNLSGHNLYLRGKTPGQFKVIFELTDPQDPLIRLEKNPAEEVMGVVEIQMRVFEHDAAELAKIKIDPDTDPIATYHTNLKNQELPNQVVLSTEKKVKVGRLLHAQKDDNFSRARVVVKINPDEWPSGTDAYEIGFDTEKTSGDVELFDAEWEGTVRGSFTVSSLKSNKEQTSWVEGKTITTKWRDVRLYLVMDRDVYGLPKKPKRNADWARFTVVEITEVKVHYDPEAGKAVAWDEPKKKFYINFKQDPDGRKVTIGAKINPALKDVTIHLMLAPDEHNLKQPNWGVDLPATWKWKDVDAALKHKDKNDRKDLLHLSAKTDDQGLAKKELVLSRFGGDKFWPAAYIDQDPHLAKYVEEHADLKKKEPVFAAKEITVWRKVWYQVTRANDHSVPDAAGSRDAYDRAKVEFVATAEVTIDPAAAPPQTYYKQWMLRPGQGDVNRLILGKHNKDAFFAKLRVDEAEKPKSHIVVCFEVCDPKGTTGIQGPFEITGFEDLANRRSGPFTMALGYKEAIVDPPLDGNPLLNSSRWANHNDTASGTLDPGAIVVESTRSGVGEFKVKLPAAAPVPTPARPVRVWVDLRKADGPWMGTAYGEHVMVRFKPGDEPDSNFVDTVTHEIGHSLGQVYVDNVPGVPPHPNLDPEQQNGNHCLYDFPANTCMMYKSGPTPTDLHRFCDTCHPYLLLRDMVTLA